MIKEFEQFTLSDLQAKKQRIEQGSLLVTTLYETIGTAEEPSKFSVDRIANMAVSDQSFQNPLEQILFIGRAREQSKAVIENQRQKIAEKTLPMLSYTGQIVEVAVMHATKDISDQEFVEACESYNELRATLLPNRGPRPYGAETKQESAIQPLTKEQISYLASLIIAAQRQPLTLATGDNRPFSITDNSVKEACLALASINQQQSPVLLQAEGETLLNLLYSSLLTEPDILYDYHNSETTEQVRLLYIYLYDQLSSENSEAFKDLLSQMANDPNLPLRIANQIRQEQTEGLLEIGEDRSLAPLEDKPKHYAIEKLFLTIDVRQVMNDIVSDILRAGRHKPITVGQLAVLYNELTVNVNKVFASDAKYYEEERRFIRPKRGL